MGRINWEKSRKKDRIARQGSEPSETAPRSSTSAATTIEARVGAPRRRRKSVVEAILERLNKKKKWPRKAGAATPFSVERRSIPGSRKDKLKKP
jgi:hypothetical protein